MMNESNPDRRIAEFLLKEYGDQRESRGHMTANIENLSKGQERLEKGQNKMTIWIYVVVGTSSVSAGASAIPRAFPDHYDALKSFVQQLLPFLA